MAIFEHGKAQGRVTPQDIAIQVLITLVSTALLLQLWKTDLRVPINYWGDTIYELALVKSIADGGWIWFIERLGAPFGLEIAAFPQNLTTSSVVMKIISLFTSEPGFILNTFWIASIAATSVFSYIALRSLGASRGSGLILSTLYALMPYALYRNVAHISLTYTFIAPIAALAISNLAHANAEKNRSHSPTSQERALVVGCCIAVGFDYIYNSFFACFFLFASGFIGAISAGSWKPIKRIAPHILIIIACVGINLTPTILSWNSVGLPASMDYKNPAEAETYGLKIRHILSPLLPINDQKINFPLENENQFSTPGAMGAIGFLIAIVFSLNGKNENESKLGHSAGRLTIIGTLLATIGGFGAIFNALISPDIRAYNRIVVFLAFFSFFALSIALDSVHSKLKTLLASKGMDRWNTSITLAFLFGILFLGLLGNLKYADRLTSKYQEFKNQEMDEREFVERIENDFPVLSQIYQLPATDFPPDGGQNRLLTYDHGRAYLWSQKIRWSWPNFSNTQRTWSARIGSPDSSSFLHGLVLSEFSAIWLDRFGYTDPDLESLEGFLTSELGPSIATSNSGRYSLFDLSKKREQWIKTNSAAERAEAKKNLFNPIEIAFGDGFFDQETESGSGEPFRWSKKSSTASVYNSSEKTLRLELTAIIKGNPGGVVSIVSERSQRSFEIEVGEAPVSFIFDLEPRKTTTIEFRFNGSRIHAPSDPREMYFSIVTPTLHEVN